MKYEKENIEKDYNLALSSFIYHRCLLRDSLAIVLIDSFVMSLSLIVSNAILLWMNGITFSIVNGWLLIPGWIVYALLSKLLPGWGIGASDELRKIQRTLFAFFASVLIISFVSRTNLASSRIVFLITYLFAAIFLPLMRHWIRDLMAKQNFWGVPVSIYGSADKVESTLDVLQSDLKLGYQPAAIYSDDLSVGSFIKEVPVLGDMIASNSTTPVGLIIQDTIDDQQFNLFIHGPAEHYRRVIILPELLAAPSLWVSPIDFEGVLGLEVTKNLLNPLSRIGKMSADYAAVLLTFPIWILIVVLLYVLIWLEDRKNPLFLQKRIGKNGKSFATIKFRTMVPNAEERLKESLQADPILRAEWEKHFKLKKDPRITKIGIILRRTSLDELPQLFNVLNGSMSVVGPRPLPSYHFEDLPEMVQKLRHQVKPGITGLWQVSGRSEAGTVGMEKWDPYYVRNWSIWLDIIILVKTIRAVIFARGAY